MYKVNHDIVLGLNFGDEGKGKMVDYLAQHYDVVVRSNGGPNSGHTIVLDGQKYVLRLIPSGVLNANVKCILAQGMVLDLDVLISEIESLQSNGINLENRLFISDSAHMIMNYHLEEEIHSGLSKKIGTTGKGIGPAYRDKTSRRGIRVCDCLDKDIFENKYYANQESVNIHNLTISKNVEYIDNYLKSFEKINKYICNTSFLINSLADQNILFESAQGTMLDLDHGTYPYVTSSNPCAAGICMGAGVGPGFIDDVVGITKAYSTRVGAGPFPTKITGAQSEKIALAGNEFGSVTKRPRDIGWLDMMLLNYACMVNSCNSLIMTKLDVLTGIGDIALCIGYKLGSKQYSLHDHNIYQMNLPIYKLEQMEPIYLEFDGWNEDIEQARSWVELPESVHSYIRCIEYMSNRKIELISVGADREATFSIKEK